MTSLKVAVILGLLALSSSGRAEEIPFTHESFDGFKIDAKLALPEGVKEDAVTRVVVLVGGSGAYDMDLDLTVVSKDPKTKNLWLKDVSDALAAKGFATVRYNKRPYQINELIKAAKAEKREATESDRTLVKSFRDNPLKCYVDDCKSFAEDAKKRFPKAKILLLGGSEGTHVALWAANEMKSIDGVALIGFYARSLDTVTYEQMVWRDESHFRKLDAGGDGALSKDDLKADDPLAKTLAGQLEAIDLDKDGSLSLMEYKAFCLVAWSQVGDVGDAYRRQEAAYPSAFDVLKGASFPVAFFEGMYDNQTPPCNAMAAEVLARYVWKKDTFRFRYFPKLGHCLDPRDSADDLMFSRIDPEAAKKVAEEMDGLFR